MMKKILFFLAVAVFAITGCVEKTEIYSDPEVRIETSSPYVVFDAAGGTKTVVVTSNYTWEYSCDGDWITVTEGESSLEIVAVENTSSESRYAYISLTAWNGSLSATAEISVAQTSHEGVDLTEKTANCFVVNTGTTYYFNATVKGCGVDDTYGGPAAYIAKYGLAVETSDIVYADLLWESAFDGDKTRSRNIIVGNPVYVGGLIRFTTGSAEGNAVIAAKDAQGTVLWSWHIWVCDSEIADLSGNGLRWMDRNLGALSTEDGDIDSRGLLYQWGRKDPFLPSNAADADVFNIQVGDGSGTWNYSDLMTRRSSAAPGNIAYSIENPMSVLQQNAAVYAWYMSAENSDLFESLLWGDSSETGAKSIFDPCPAGYRVPSGTPWGTADWTAGEYGYYWTAGGNAYFPAAGYMYNGECNGSGEQGCYWSADTNADSYNAGCLTFSASSNPGSSADYPVKAFAVRCVKEE